MFLADEHTIDISKNSRELYCTFSLSTPDFYGPVRLPSGVKITKLEYFGRDASTVSGNNVASLRRTCQITDVADPEVVPLTPEISTTGGFDAGNFYAAADLAETVDNRSCAYHVVVQFPGGCDAAFIRIYKARLQWQR